MSARVVGACFLSPQYLKAFCFSGKYNCFRYASYYLQ